jgi:hypothetical protein
MATTRTFSQAACLVVLTGCLVVATAARADAAPGKRRGLPFLRGAGAVGVAGAAVPFLLRQSGALGGPVGLRLPILQPGGNVLLNPQPLPPRLGVATGVLRVIRVLR